MGPPFCLERSVFSARFMMFAHERAEMDFFGVLYFARVLVFCFCRSNCPSLDHAQFADNFFLNVHFGKKFKLIEFWMQIFKIINFYFLNYLNIHFLKDCSRKVEVRGIRRLGVRCTRSFPGRPYRGVPWHLLYTNRTLTVH